jgi:hypothetical protein
MLTSTATVVVVGAGALPNHPVSAAAAATEMFIVTILCAQT